MEKSINPNLHYNYKPTDLKAMNPVTLAFIGDSVFSDYIRRYLLATGIQNVNHLTKKSICFVNASGQAAAVRALQPILSEEENDLVRRGRNSHSHVPKNAKAIDYRYATGFEALLGYLSLSGQTDRLEFLISQGIQIIEEKLKQPKK